MSLASKITLSVAFVISGGIIGYVHFKQTNDREKLHQGVVRDVERQHRRNLENTYMPQQQIELTKLKQLQKQDEANVAQ